MTVVSGENELNDQNGGREKDLRDYDTEESSLRCRKDK